MTLLKQTYQWHFWGACKTNRTGRFGNISAPKGTRGRDCTCYRIPALCAQLWPDTVRFSGFSTKLDSKLHSRCLFGPDTGTVADRWVFLDRCRTETVWLYRWFLKGRQQDRCSPNYVLFYLKKIEMKLQKKTFTAYLRKQQVHLKGAANIETRHFPHKDHQR